MVEFLDTNGTSAEISKLISRSKQKLFIVSPYFQIPDPFKKMVLHAQNETPELDIRFLYRYEENKKLNDKDSEFLFKQLYIARIFSLENLHAKCYLNENTAIITSMNLYRYSQQNNYEMGVKVDRTNPNDQMMYDDILRHIDFLMKSGKEYSRTGVLLSNLSSNIGSTLKKVGKVVIPNSGYCIRCNERIDTDREKPLCEKCYKSWARYKDGNYSEKFCHYCGKAAKTSFNKPFCMDCFKELNK